MGTLNTGAPKWTVSEMSLKQMQQTIDEWIVDNGGYWEELALLARLTEEVESWRENTTIDLDPKRKRSPNRMWHWKKKCPMFCGFSFAWPINRESDLQEAFQVTMQRSLGAIPVVLLGPSRRAKGPSSRGYQYESNPAFWKVPYRRDGGIGVTIGLWLLW